MPSTIRIGVLSDIHANLPALETALDYLDGLHVDGIIVAGDTVNLGPQPRETLALLHSRDPWIIRGNHEDYIRDLDEDEAARKARAGAAWAVLRWTYAQLDADDRAYLAGLPTQRVVHLPGTSPIRVVHGSPRRTNELLVPADEAIAAEMMENFRRIGLADADAVIAPFDEAIDGLNEPTLVCGHSHRAWRFQRPGLLALNPGTVGCPDNGQPRAQYGVLTWDGANWQAELYSCAYDRSRLARAFEESGLLATGAAAQSFRLHMLEARCLFLHLSAHVQRTAQAWGWPTTDPLPDALWEKAAMTFDWNQASGIKK